MTPPTEFAHAFAELGAVTIHYVSAGADPAQLRRPWCCCTAGRRPGSSGAMSCRLIAANAIR